MQPQQRSKTLKSSVDAANMETNLCVNALGNYYISVIDLDVREVVGMRLFYDNWTQAQEYYDKHVKAGVKD